MGSKYPHPRVTTSRTATGSHWDLPRCWDHRMDTLERGHQEDPQGLMDPTTVTQGLHSATLNIVDHHPATQNFVDHPQNTSEVPDLSSMALHLA